MGLITKQRRGVVTSTPLVAERHSPESTRTARPAEWAGGRPRHARGDVVQWAAVVALRQRPHADELAHGPLRGLDGQSGLDTIPPPPGPQPQSRWRVVRQ